jgi:hypothetical protein
VDAIIWLGYGSTFPVSRPESWEQAGQFHKRLLASAPSKPKARLAVVRPYRTWALSSQCNGQIRNPADWMLQQWLQVWSVRHGQPYDIFEVPPGQSAAQREQLQVALKSYPFSVSTEDRDGVRVIGAGTEGTVIDPATAEQLQSRYERELITTGWLTCP